MSRGGSKFSVHISFDLITIWLFRTAILILNCSIPQPWMQYRGHYHPLWHLSCKLRMFLKRRNLNWELCSRIRCLLCCAGFHMWIHHLCQYLLHQEPRISKHLHSFKCGDLHLHHPEIQWWCKIVTPYNWDFTPKPIHLFNLSVLYFYKYSFWSFDDYLTNSKMGPSCEHILARHYLSDLQSPDNWGLKSVSVISYQSIW